MSSTTASSAGANKENKDANVASQQQAMSSKQAAGDAVDVTQAVEPGDLAEGSDVFAIAGVAPEVLAVAMAKYSRSQASVKETLADLTEEKSAAFHEKWVLGYGDASVADMAIVALALENVSILASKAIEDHRIASYQEKSTRYVPFFRCFPPAPIMAQPALAQVFQCHVKALFASYDRLRDMLQSYYAQQYPKPDTMSDKLYAARLRARALDVARYTLPTATVTNFGMIASARTLRHAIAKLKVHELQEVRDLAVAMESAATGQAYNPHAQRLATPLASLQQAASSNAAIAQPVAELSAALSLQAKGAPTLVRHTEPKQGLRDLSAVVTAWITQHVAQGLLLLHRDHSDAATPPRVRLHAGLDPTTELVASLVYTHSTASFADILAVLAEHVSQDAKAELVRRVHSVRGQHDHPSREFEVGHWLIFDTLMDYGAFRDLQRHRICTQLHQPLRPSLGYEVPQDLAEAGALPVYAAAMDAAADAFATLAAGVGEAEATYALPLAFRKRTLFKMNLREFYHMVELRSKSGGHFSYRTLVYEMYQAVQAHSPLLVEQMRVVKMDFAADFYNR